MVGSFPLVLVANPSQKFRDLKQLVAIAKAAPSGIDVGSSGVGSSGHVATEIFARTAGLELNHVPYKGGLPALQGTVAGDIPMMWSSVGAALPLVNGGKLVADCGGEHRALSVDADVPTFEEQGYPNFTAGNWPRSGTAALPDALAQKIYSDVEPRSNEAYRKTSARRRHRSVQHVIGKSCRGSIAANTIATRRCSPPQP